MNHNTKSNEKNDQMLSQFAVTRRQSRSLYRNLAIVSRKSAANPIQSQTNVFTKTFDGNVESDCVDHSKESSSSLIEDRADEIVRHLEHSQILMDDNPKSNNNRMETLRDMTEYLTLKRSVKRKLTKSIGSINNTLSFSQRLKYSISIFFYKIPISIKHFTSSFELWYSSLKIIEGHFGSNVASYFKFLRKLFLLNTSIFILMLFFVMLPQLLFRLFQYVEENQHFNSSANFSLSSDEKNSYLYFIGGKAQIEPLIMPKSNPYQENDEFRLGNLFTGEGFLTNTILFYGYYTNTSLQLIKGHNYNIPAAYFFTSAVCYILIFFFLFTSVAVSYRKCYIETSGSMHNTFSNKIICGWDFGIATKQASDLKSKSIYIELKELLDEISKPKKKRTCINSFYTTAISLSLNGLLLFLLGLGGMYSWKYLDQQMTKADTATTMMMWLILTLVVAVAPVLFSLIAHLEDFESPSSALYMTLVRTFILYAIVIAVVVAYRINRSEESECWETILGQDMFRLVILDFIFGSIGTALSEFIRYRIFIKMWKGIGCPEFDFARSTMNLIYNQTLFYVGLFFSPVLSLLITIKLFIIFYIKKWGAIYNCKPFVKPWKAYQAHTVYLSIAFFAFFCVVIAYGYIITSVRTSNCGPFRGKKFIYERLLEEILSNKNSSLLMVAYYVTRPGVVGIVLMVMLLGVYYMRAVALARIHVAKHLRHLLRLKAEDRKLLLSEISKYTRNQDSPDNSDSDSVDFQGYKVSGVRGNSLRNKNKFLSKNKIKSQHSLSSLNNLQFEPEFEYIRRSKCKSEQNIGSCMDEGSLKYELKPMQVEENIIKDSALQRKYQNSDSEYKYDFDANGFKEAFLNINKSNKSSSKESVNSSLCDSDVKNEKGNFGGVIQLNFNPVFTESIPLDFIVEKNNQDGSGEVSRTLEQREEEKPHVERNDLPEPTKYPKNYLDVDERVPSRISFNSNQKRYSQSKIS